MKLFSTKELRARFAAVEAAKVQSFEKEFRRPSPPDAKVIEMELRNGEVRVDRARLVASMLPPSRSRYCEPEDETLDVNFFDVVSTPSLRMWKQRLACWAADLKSYKKELADARDMFLDRIILDHESAYVLLQDFKVWVPKDAR